MKRISNEQVIEAAEATALEFAASHPTIAQAVTAWANQIRDATNEGATREDARQSAAIAYKANMPAMTDRDGVRAFVDAVAHGLLIGVFNGKEGASLLYAAQVAISANAKVKEEREPWDSTTRRTQSRPQPGANNVGPQRRIASSEESLLDASNAKRHPRRRNGPGPQRSPQRNR